MMKVPNPAAATTFVASLASMLSSASSLSSSWSSSSVWPRSLWNRGSTSRRQSLVSLHGTLRPTLGLHEAGRRPPDPHQILTSEQQLVEQQGKLIDWFLQHHGGPAPNNNHDGGGGGGILCLTGAGLSTESGLRDYRGHQGSYHVGHKPMLHDQFVSSATHRQRYWGRSLIGWQSFASAQPSVGHAALAQLEQGQHVGVTFGTDDDDTSPDTTLEDDAVQRNNVQQQTQRLAVVTQNVDGLHRRAGSRDVLELHGRSDQLECLQCGHVSCRHTFHTQLQDLNRAWLQQQQPQHQETTAVTHHPSSSIMRPDGDAAVESDFRDLIVPHCAKCQTGILKPAVVFFGDVVPPHRVAQFRAAVRHASGLLVVGSSLAVHSAYRHVREAYQLGIPIAILNVGETRAEAEGLSERVLKIEAPAGPTLAGVASYFKKAKGGEEIVMES